MATKTQTIIETDEYLRLLEIEKKYNESEGKKTRHIVTRFVNSSTEIVTDDENFTKTKEIYEKRQRLLLEDLEKCRSEIYRLNLHIHRHETFIKKMCSEFSNLKICMNKHINGLTMFNASKYKQLIAAKFNKLASTIEKGIAEDAPKNILNY